ncbi:MAG: FtsX-like permease family protein, partial [Bryobacteraceae bacterium]
LVEKDLQRERMLMSLSACFAVIALLLTAIGLYGLLARIVTLRTKEIGLRLALGAQPRNAVTPVIRQALQLVLAGIGIGLLAAFGVMRLLRTLLFGVQADNPWMLSAAAAVLILVALLASYIPARRAAKVDPMLALREE